MSTRYWSGGVATFASESDGGAEVVRADHGPRAVVGPVSRFILLPHDDTPCSPKPGHCRSDPPSLGSSRP